MQNHALATLHHVPGRRLRDVEHAGKINGHHFVPLFRRNVEKVVADADAGIVYQHIDAAHEADRFGKS